MDDVYRQMLSEVISPGGDDEEAEHASACEQNEDDDEEMSSAEEDSKRRVHPPAPPPRPFSFASLFQSRSHPPSSSSSSSANQSLPPPDHSLSDLAKLQLEAYPMVKEGTPCIMDIRELPLMYKHMGRDPVTNMPICDAALFKMTHAHTHQHKDPSSSSNQKKGTQTRVKKEDASAVCGFVNALSITKAKSSSTVSKKKFQFAASEVQTWDQLAFQDLLKTMHPVHFFVREQITDLKQETFMAMLKRQQLHMPTLTSDLENKLLRESGRFFCSRRSREYVYPACLNGKDCIGMQCWIPGQIRGFTLTSVMYEDEYTRFIETGIAPQPCRPCVLCCRDNLVEWVVHRRSTSMMTNMQHTETSVNKIEQVYSNLVDCQGGYFRSYVFFPVPGEAQIDPICRTNLSMIRVLDDPGTRARVDQSALIWRPSIHDNPHTGENLSHFLRRSKSNLTAPLSTKDRPELEARVAITVPRGPSSPDLLRETHIKREGIPVYQDDHASPFSSWTAAVVFDATHVTGDYERVVSYATLPNLLHRVLNLSYFAPLSSSDPMQYLLSKVLNQRCQARKYWAVTLVHMHNEEEGGKQLTIDLKRLVLCSLLGNYLHSPASSRPCKESRERLYEIFLNPARNPRFDQWFETLVRSCSPILVFALRDYLVYAIGESPALYRRLNRVMHFDKFKEVAEEGTTATRAYFDNHLSEPLSELSVCLEDKKGEITTGWCSDVCLLLQPAHAQMLKIAYKRNNVNMAHVIQCARKPIPMTRRLQAEDDEESEKEEYDSCSDMYICASQYKAIQELVARVDDMAVISRHLVHFGVEDQVARSLELLLKHHEKTMSGVALIRKHLSMLKADAPHAYNLIQVAADLVLERHKKETISDLPLSYTVNQISAIQGRYGTGDKIVGSDLFFRFCPVCDTIYSIVREFKDDKRDVPDCSIGFQDALVDYQTNQLYCSQTKKTHRGVCGKVPLAGICILGKLLVYKGKSIILCPQESCGAPMSYNADKCAYTERGPACSVCTYRIKQRYSEYKQLVAEHTRADSRCAKCGCELRSSSSIYLFPHDVRMCKQHCTNGLIRFLGEVQKHASVASKEQLVQTVVSYFAARKASRTLAFASSNKRQLQANKFRSRMKR